MDKERLQKQLDFILEIDKEKNILRQTHLSNHGRREDDAEHAWHMAVMAYLLKEYSNEPVDIGKVMIMCLIHDVVEIDAGDTYAYDSDGLKTQKGREEKAKARIFGMLPPDQAEDLMAIWEEFEDYKTPESKFAHTMDNFQPLLLNNSNDGGDWKEHKVNIKQVRGRQDLSRLGSEEIWTVIDGILRKNVEQGAIMKAYDFYGWEDCMVSPSNPEYKDISNPQVLYDILSGIWCEYTCAPRMRSDWSSDNRTLGQCSITAFLVQDIFGGEVRGILRPGGNYHCFNVVDGKTFDLTSEQFGGEVLDYSDCPLQSREVHFGKLEKKERYEYLKARLSERKINE